MFRHWAFQYLAFVACILALTFWLPDKTDFCRNTKLPEAFIEIATWAHICPPVTIVYIPSVITSPELHSLQLLTNQLPDATEMVKNRIEIGKISAALAAIGTPESLLKIEAVEKYNNEAKAMLRSLSKLSYISMLTRKTLAGSIAGIIKALDRFPRGEKRRRTLQALILSQQVAIDAWVRGLQDELKELHAQTVETLANLDGCDFHLKQAIRISRRQQPEDIISPDAIEDWGSTLFEDGHGRIRPAALEAATKLGALIRESSIARNVVGRVSVDVAKLMAGIEAAYRHPDQMLAVDVILEKEVELMVDMLRKVEGDVQLGGLTHSDTGLLD